MRAGSLGPALFPVLCFSHIERRDTLRYAVKKLATLLVTMLIVSFAAFFAFSLVAGDAATSILGSEATADD